ncbi:mrna cap methylation rnmt-activating mini protein [Holotrichia oblita]|uniref:Mrna cap methylation rnmt-activating mini protein n=1 Tax=Holotrichia oblita TaxID=644536 RepID=A0ACB9TCF8_HOLOL|nr:mrna cap methylation rnmt-activating mini protein [Holotrichia oblita]
MTTNTNLTREQLEFLKACEQEFSDRFTDSDMEYKLVKEAGIPKPPIMLNWYPKPTLLYRGPPGSRYSNYRHHHDKPYQRHHDRYRDKDRERERERYSDHNSHRSGDRRYR